MAHGDSPYDVPEMMEEMGFCPDCHDHMPCGCDHGPDEDEEEFPLLTLDDPLY